MSSQERTPTRSPSGTEERGSERGVVAGVFADEDQAAQAVKALIEAEFFPPLDLSVIASHRREHQAVPVTEDWQVIQRAKTGATIGAVLGGAGATLVGLTFGPLSLVAAGPVVAALEAAYLSGASGFAAGAMIGLGIWKKEAEFHATHIHNGVVWIGVHAEGERAVEAHRILTEAGAKHFTE